MKPADFKLERFFALHELSSAYLLSASDCESLTVEDLLALEGDDAAERLASLRLGYGDAAGDPALRDAVASLYTGLSADEILTGAPEECIFIALTSLLEPGDHVIVTSPAYQSLLELPRAAGCRVSEWRLERTATGWLLDLDELTRLSAGGVKMIVVNFPHNPTGYLPDRDEFEAIVETADRHGAVLFSDEMYRYLEQNDAERLPPACELYRSAISLGGLSKAYGLPGLRTGWLASRETSLLTPAAAMKDYTTICASAPVEFLARIAVENTATITWRCREIIRPNLEAAEAFFASHREWFGWIPPRAGSVAFPELLPSNPGGIATADELSALLRERENALLLSGTLFDRNPAEFRIGLGRLSFPEALERLSHVLEHAAGR